MKRFICILVLFLVLISHSHAKQLVFSNYSINEGLSQSVVNCVFQDSRGFIWMGTQNGLNRFDGENFEVYRFSPADPNSLSNNWIYSISEDNEGNLWIGTKGGLNKFLRSKNYFVHFNYQTSFTHDLTQHIYDNICLKNGNILINTPPVLSIYNPVSGEFSHFQNNLEYNRAVKDTKIPVLEDKDGNVWLGSTVGLSRFSFETNKFTSYTFFDTTGKELEAVNITALYKDKKDRFWAGTTLGLYLFDANFDVFKEVAFLQKSGEKWLFTNTCISAILEDWTGNLIVGTEGSGMYVLEQDAEANFLIQNYTSENSAIGHDIVQDFVIDKSNNLWVGTLSGISKADLKKNKFNIYRNTNAPNTINLLGNVIAGMYKNDDGILWVGNWGQGLNLVNLVNNEVEHFSSQLTGNHYISNDFVHVIFKDSEKNIWLGTRDGILIYDKPNNQFLDWRTFFNDSDLPAFKDVRIYQIIQDKLNDYWIATSIGLYRVNLQNNTVEAFQAELEERHRISANLVYSILEDTDGLIWIATIRGLDLYNPETKLLTHFVKKEKGLSSDFIVSICEDSNKQIWIGTNAYLNVFDKKDSSFIYYTKEDGLPSNYIYEIAMDKNQDLWFATGGGLAKFNKQSKTFQSFSEEDGLQSLEFNLRSSCSCESGEMLFGGMNGFNSFNPDSIAGNPFVPNVVFTSFSKNVGSKQEQINQSQKGEVVLNHKESFFNIEFAALEFTNPEKNEYAYKMEGISDDWINIGNRKFVPFFALRAGEYVFRVKGSNNDGVWSAHDASIRIVVLPPWWRSTVAYLVYVMVVLLGIIAFVKLRERKLKYDYILLEKKVLERTLQIKEQNRVITSKNEELNELNRTKDKFFSIIGHDLRNHFNVIIGFSENLLSAYKNTEEEKREHYISNIYKSSVQAHDLLGNLLTWARLQRNRITFHPEKINAAAKIRELLAFHEEAALKKNILIEVFAKEELVVSADVNMFSTIIRNLLANAIKFTPEDGEISVSLKKEGGSCKVKVSDTGVGIPKENLEKIFRVDSNVSTKGTDGEKGTGLGLVLCKEFVEKHDGEIYVESEMGKGSSFVFVLPLYKA